MALASFSVFVMSSPDHVLDAGKAFVSLSLFNLMNFPLSILPGTISFGVNVSEIIQIVMRLKYCPVIYFYSPNIRIIYFSED